MSAQPLLKLLSERQLATDHGELEPRTGLVDLGHKHVPKIRRPSLLERLATALAAPRTADRGLVDLLLRLSEDGES